MKRILFSGAALMLIAAPGAFAQAANLEELTRCLVIEDDTERLACFDAAVSSLAGDQSGDRLVVVDLDDAESIERDSFGLDLPALPRLSLSILATRDRLGLSTKGPESTPAPESAVAQNDQITPQTVPHGSVDPAPPISARVIERDQDGSIERLELVVQEVRGRSYDRVEIVMVNGQVWSIIGGPNADLLPRRIREGTPAVIRRGAMNSYLLQFDDRGAAYRVDRTR